MRLLLIVDDYLPHSIKVAAKMMHELAVEFVHRGHDITVLTPNSALKERLSVKELEGVRILSFKSGEIKNIGRIQRAINETFLSTLAWIAVKRYLRENVPDAVIYYSPTIFFGSLVGKIKRNWKVKSYLILRDVFPQWTVDNGLIRENSLIHRYFRYYERINYKNADWIGVMSPSNLSFFKTLPIDIDKFEVLFNWSKIGRVEKTQCVYRKQLGLEDKVVFFYGGNIGVAQNMQNLIRLAINLKDNEKAHLLFVGEGDEVDLILSEKNRNHLDNMTYLPPVNQDIYFEMMNEFDVGLFSLHPEHTTHNFPGKLLGYMEYSKPILGSVNMGNDLMDVISKNKAGYIFENGNDEELCKAAIELINSESLRIKTGENGRELLIKQFSVERACTQIENRFINYD